MRTGPAIVLVGVLFGFALHGRGTAPGVPEVAQVSLGVARLVQVGAVRTGFEGPGGAARTVPSIDPASVTYHAPSGHLFLADPEIEEADVAAAWRRVRANLFELAPDGSTLHRTYDLLRVRGAPPNDEPTGIAYCEADDRFYVTNDDRELVYRYRLRGDRFRAEAVVSTLPYSDPEGIACDDERRRLYVVDGGLHVLVYRYARGFRLEEVIDLRDARGPTPRDPEGIAFDPVSRHLFVLSGKDDAIYEYTRSGRYVGVHSIEHLTPRPVTAQGIAIGPSSRDPRRRSFYIADGGRDNQQDADERDGVLYELEIRREAGGLAHSP